MTKLKLKKKILFTGLAFAIPLVAGVSSACSTTTNKDTSGTKNRSEIEKTLPAAPHDDHDHDHDHHDHDHHDHSEKPTTTKSPVTATHDDHDHDHNHKHDHNHNDGPSWHKHFQR